MKNLFLRLIRMLDDEVFYIGGADVLPAPLSAAEEQECIDRLGKPDSREGEKIRLIEHNLRLVVYIAKNLTIPRGGGGSDLHRDDRSDEGDQYV